MNLNISLDDVGLLVVKVGTTLVSSPTEPDFLSRKKMQPIVEDIAAFRKRGIKVILVTSGAIGAGMAVLGLKRRPKLLPQKQAAAAIGQSKLMHFYKEMFNECGMRVAQILLTKDDLDERAKYLNARNTLSTLLQYDMIVPIINENDTVAVDEIKFGDNDTLAAVVASKMQADLLVILSNVDGLYDCDPRKNSAHKLIEEVRDLSEDIRRMCGGSSTETSVGGMMAKMEAARIAILSGIGMILANGEKNHILRDIFSGGARFTYFHPRQDAINGRKRWIAFGAAPHGKIRIDEGARRAVLQDCRSLLPSGVVGVTGAFERGDTVSIIDDRNKEIARGLTNYSADEIVKIKGLHSSRIAEVLGHKDYDEVVHRDHLVVLEGN
jgi:glutamate 5-kinase